jgi:RHS repeat-associated protein
MTQDAVMGANKQWLFTKYDQFGRPAYTGIYTSTQISGTAGRIVEQTQANAAGNNNVTRTSTTGFTNSSMDVYYDNGVSSYPNTITKLFSVNYYDSYLTGDPFPTLVFDQAVLPSDIQQYGRSTKGLPVSNYVKNIEDDNWTKNYQYYDLKARLIRLFTLNHLGGYTNVEKQLDFSGAVKQTLTQHRRLSTDTERTINEVFTYDTQNRLLTHTHQVGTAAIEYLAQNKYNELSQLESKKVGGISMTSPLQQLDYKYNIRGWMTKINDPAILNGKLFGYELRYTNPVNANIAPGRFNGNITEVDWKNASEDVLKRYNYDYDNLSRLKNAFYQEPGTSNDGKFNEYLTYDLNGNISNLKRTAVPVGQLTPTLVDNLDYQYTGNRLNKVIENSLNETGYEGGNNQISYDLNGSMINMKDKGINTIAYNYLNLPDSYSITQNDPLAGTVNFGLDYLYRADGVKVRKTNSRGGGKGSPLTKNITDYLDGFQYSYYESSTCIWCKTSVAFEQEAFKDGSPIIDPAGPLDPQWILDFVPTAEGFYSFKENRYIYQYKDHLGNARVTYAKNGKGILETIDTNNYYAFGMNHIGQVKGLLGSYESYKYNGKEIQETGMYDYGARFYMPDLGRWGVVDPLAEIMRRQSPYNYALNNPIMFIDPDGRAAGGPGDGSDGKTIRTQDIEEIVLVGRKKVGNFFSRLWNGIKNGLKNEYSSKTNNDKYGGLSSYRQWQGSPFYNEGESKTDRIFRLIGNSKREEMLDFGGGGYNMFGGYGRAAKAASAVEASVGEAKTISPIPYTVEESGNHFGIFSFEGRGDAPEMTVVANLDPEGTHVNIKIDIMPTDVFYGGQKLEASHAQYAGKVGIEGYKSAIESWVKNKGLGYKTVSYYGERATGRATGRVQTSKKFNIE